MMEKDDILTYAKSDLSYIDLIGQFVKYNRLNQNKTQSQLAIEAGINRSTLIQLEKGSPISLLSLIPVLRALKQLHILKPLEVRPQLSPLMLAEIEEKQRKRVGKSKNIMPNNQNRKQSDW